jgi:hypothetical protein
VGERIHCRGKTLQGRRSEPEGAGASPRHHHARDVAQRNRVRAGLGHQSTRQETASSSPWERRSGGADDGADSIACCQPTTDCDFNQAALHPAYPIKRQRARREHRHPKASKPGPPPRPIRERNWSTPAGRNAQIADARDGMTNGVRPRLCENSAKCSEALNFEATAARIRQPMRCRAAPTRSGE